MQKNIPQHFPEWVSRTEVKKRDGVVCHVVCDKAPTLVYLANQGCIELHMFLSALRALDTPDQLVFDLDPPDADHFAEVCRHALALRTLLEGELRTVRDRIAESSDPWDGMARHRHGLSGPRRRLAALSTS